MRLAKQASGGHAFKLPLAGLVRTALTCGFISLCVMLLRDRFATVELADVGAALSEIAPASIALAFVLGAISHIGLAGYDMLAFTRIGRWVPWTRALKGGFAGTVMSQTVGLGLITGTYARSRIYRANGIGPAEAFAVSTFVATGFFMGIGVLLACLLIIDPAPAVAALHLGPDVVRILSASGLVGALLLVALRSRVAGEIRLGKTCLSLPNGTWLARATALAAADLIPAALCLAVLLPADAMPSFAAFVAIYITAMALGHLTGAPGAVGAFEGIVFLALPMVPPDALIAGVLAYRAIYYLPSFALSMVFIFGARGSPDVTPIGPKEIRDHVAWVVDSAPQAEGELAYLGDKLIYAPRGSAAFAMYAMTGRFWVLMGDPVGPESAWPDLLDAMDTEARTHGATLVSYKATDAARAYWSARGHRILPLGHEGVLDAASFSLDGSARRELRRKCRTVEKAGVEIRAHAPGAAPLGEMAALAEAWRTDKSRPEQSFSMGHWSPSFAARHPMFAAYLDGRLIAFLTIWTSGDGSEWMLDLMRQRSDAPNGTMHALIAAAAIAAREADVADFNLCMAPLSGLDAAEPQSWLTRAGDTIYRRYDRHHGLQGLRRFKEIFRPVWAQRYLAAPTTLDLIEALFAVHRLVHGQADPARTETERCPWLRPQQSVEAHMSSVEETKASAPMAESGPADQRPRHQNAA